MDGGGIAIFLFLFAVTGIFNIRMSLAPALFEWRPTITDI